jgi:hypothetical protein
VGSLEGGNTDAAAFAAGTLLGGLGVGVLGGGRGLGQGISGQPSQVRPSCNPIGDIGLGYDPNFPNSNFWNWLGSAPTPQSGAALTTGLGGLGTEW